MEEKSVIPKNPSACLLKCNLVVEILVGNSFEGKLFVVLLLFYLFTYRVLS